MSLKTAVDLTATRLHPAALAEAKEYPVAQADHPHAYCRQYVGMSGANTVINISAGGARCPKGFSLLGYVSDATRSQLLSSNTEGHAEGAADRMVKGGLQVSKAELGLGGAVTLSVAAAALAATILASDPAFFYGMSVAAATGTIAVVCVAIVIGGIALYLLTDHDHRGSSGHE